MTGTSEPASVRLMSLTLSGHTAPEQKELLSLMAQATRKHLVQTALPFQELGRRPGPSKNQRHLTNARIGKEL